MKKQTVQSILEKKNWVTIILLEDSYDSDPWIAYLLQEHYIIKIYKSHQKELVSDLSKAYGLYITDLLKEFLKSYVLKVYGKPRSEMIMYPYIRPIGTIQEGIERLNYLYNMINERT